ncbi:MAG: CRISPR-associated protein Cas6 [Peptococcia bacterium]|jgi:CRISPR-associated endoribonuclease Cas6
MNNCFFELLSTIQFNEDVKAKDVQYGLARLIASAMLNDAELKELHHHRGIKKYTFSAPYPLEKDQVYRKGRLYCFNLRTLDLKFALAMKQYLPLAEGVAKVIAVEVRNYKQSPIKELISLTPVVCTVNNRCWMPENGVGLLAERLHQNALKKQQLLDPSFSAPGEFFFECINLLNKKPIIVTYKNTVLLGHKLQIEVKPHDWAQQLAFTVLAQGLLEKTAEGFGYCITGR